MAMARWDKDGLTSSRNSMCNEVFLLGYFLDISSGVWCCCWVCLVLDSVVVCCCGEASDFWVFFCGVYVILSTHTELTSVCKYTLRLHDSIGKEMNWKS
jgi:hypothetical protein